MGSTRRVDLGANPRPQKKGVSAATSQFFWGRVVQESCVEIRRKGCRTLAELFDAIDARTKALAAHAFEAIDVEQLEEQRGPGRMCAEHQRCSGGTPRLMAVAILDRRSR